jgi:peptidoglycan/xylan/chitin deacetylase (PgdA/CDA1 family)
LTVHAERLERDPVWDAVRRALDQIEPRGVRVTFFVHPFKAIRAEIDIADRIKELAERGHEIAQHTHFYAEYDETSAGIHKRTDLSPEVVEGCLSRDRNYLRGAGFDPRGFVSGGWAIAPTIYAWLQNNGFIYDCSYRTYVLPYESEDARAGDDARGPFWIGSVLELPTTASLRSEASAVLRGGANRVPVDGLEYTLSYLHDYDLTDRAKFIALTRLRPIAMRGRIAHVKASEMARVVAPRLPSAPRSG